MTLLCTYAKIKITICNLTNYFYYGCLYFFLLHAHNPYFASLYYKAQSTSRIVLQILLPKMFPFTIKLVFPIFNNLRRNFQVITFIKNHQSLQQNKENSSVLHLKNMKFLMKQYQNFTIGILK